MYAACGVPVFPCRPGTKKPALVGWQAKATVNLPTIADWWRRWPNAPIGAPMGAATNLLTVDVDRAEGEAALTELQGHFGPIPDDTPSQITGSGDGRQILFCWAHGIRNSQGRVGTRIDIRGEGGYTILPPSPHPSGGAYRWIPGRAPWDVAPAKAPDWLLELATKPEAAKPPATVTQLRAVTEGVRNKTLFRLCLRQAVSCDTQAELLDRALATNGDFLPPLSAAEVRLTVASAWSYETTGRNWVGRGAHVYTTKDDLDVFRACPNGVNAMALDLVLRLEHGAREEPFAVVPTAIAAANLLPGLGWRRILAARETCVALGRLKLVRKGRGRGNPNLYRLAAGR
jgi:hypothetical protein